MDTADKPNSWNELSDEELNDKRNNDQHTITNNLPHDNQNIVKSDADLLEDDEKSLARHNKQYSELLETYVADTKRSLNFKYLKKNCVFQVSIALFFIVPIMMTIIIFICIGVTTFNTEIGALDVLPEIFAAFGSLVATYITIVKLITQYLFNKDEEKTMKDIISNIQTYDMHLRENEPNK